MADTPEDPEQPPKKRSKTGLFLGLALALLGGGGGFYATWSGLILASVSHENGTLESNKSSTAESLDVAYVEVDPLTISLRTPSQSQYLRFRASLEVFPSEVDAVTKLLPRVSDVLNNYLRALEPADLEDPSSLARLRAQMLRRVQVVTGSGKINDLLILEFVLN